MNGLPASGGLSRGKRIALGIGFGAAALILIKPLSSLVWQIVFALLLAGAALPLCKWMEKRLGRKPSALFSIVILVLGTLSAIGLLVPVIIAQIYQVIAEAPKLLNQLSALWTDLSRQEWAAFWGLGRNLPQQWIAQAGQWIGESLPKLIRGVIGWADATSRAFLSPALAYYFLRDRETFSYQASLLIPSRYRKRFLAAWQEMRLEAVGYARGQLLVAAAVGALTSAGLLIVGVPVWLILGLLMGACEWIPYMGPLIGGVPILLFSLPLGLKTTLWAMGVTVAVQQIEGYFLSPRLMAGSMELHPVAVLLLLSAGGLIGGLWGMIAALPVFVCFRAAFRVFSAARDPQPPIFSTQTLNPRDKS